MKYKNPILKEVYCEIFFEKNINISKQHLIVDEFKSEYSKTEVEQDLQSLISKDIPIRFRLWKNSNKELFQVYVNRIAFNFICTDRNNYEYIGWESFILEVMEKLGKIKDIDDSIEYKSVAVCYIDEIPNLETEKFDLSRYVSKNGKVVPTILFGESKPMDLIIGLGNTEKENLQIKLKVKNVDINLFTIGLNIRSQKRISDYSSLECDLNKLHESCNDVFTDLISDYTKNTIMGGLL